MIDFYLLWKMNFRKTFLWGGKLMNRILPVKQKSAFEKTKAQNNKEHSFASSAENTFGLSLHPYHSIPPLGLQENLWECAFSH